MALRIVLLSLILSVSAFAERLPLVIDNNIQFARIYNQPMDEHGMTMTAFRAWVKKYIKRKQIEYRRLRFIIVHTCLQREAIDCAVIDF